MDDLTVEVPADLYHGLALHEAVGKPGHYVVTHMLTRNAVIQRLLSLEEGRLAMVQLADAWSGWERYGTAEGIANAIPRKVLAMIQSFCAPAAT